MPAEARSESTAAASKSPRAGPVLEPGPAFHHGSSLNRSRITSQSVVSHGCSLRPHLCDLEKGRKTLSPHRPAWRSWRGGISETPAQGPRKPSRQASDPRSRSRAACTEIIDGSRDQDELPLRLLKTVALLNLLDAEDLPATDETLRLALDRPRKAIAEAVQDLRRRSRLYPRGVAGGYCLWPSTSVSLDQALTAARQALGSPERLAPLVAELCRSRSLVAGRHYIQSYPHLLPPRLREMLESSSWVALTAAQRHGGLHVRAGTG